MSLLLRVLTLVYFAFLVFGLVVTPRVLGDLVQERALSRERWTRARVGERMAALEDRFVELEEDVEVLRLRVAKVRLAYGLIARPEAVPPVDVESDAFPPSIYQRQIHDMARGATRVRLALGDLEGHIAELRELEAAMPELAAITPAISPLGEQAVMVSGFGYRENPSSGVKEFHAGVDLAAPVGSEIRAAADGRVVFVGSYRARRRSVWWRLGRLVAVRHGDRFLTLYGRCGRILVRSGEQVHRGDVIASVGESEMMATPNLHYAVWRREETGSFAPSDPRLFMLDRTWSDEAALVASSGQRPESWEYEALPRGLRR